MKIHLKSRDRCPKAKGNLLPGDVYVTEKGVYVMRVHVKCDEHELINLSNGALFDPPEGMRFREVEATLVIGEL